MPFFKVFSWEFLQNLPVFTGFVLAFGLWQTGKFWEAVAIIFFGCTAGAVLIALTEARKVAGHKEPVSVLLANIVGMTAFALAIVVYFSARWSSWMTDLPIGAMCGAGLGIAQDAAAKKRIGVRHCIALGIASALSLVSIRWLLNIGWPAWANIFSICLLATLIISLIDYAPKGEPS